MRTITAKFNSKCAATGQVIKKGEIIVYDPDNKKAYKQGQEPKRTEADSINDYIQAQENAYFDNFSRTL